MNIENKILNLIKLKNPDNPLKYVSDIVSPLCIDKLNEYILVCKECPSCDNSKKSIGRGNPRASILVIFDCPKGNMNKDITYPLEGTKELEYFENILDSLGVNKEEIFYINSMNCLPATRINGKTISRTPKKEERDACRTFVNYAISSINPVAILLGGAISLSLFYPKEALASSHGQWLNANGIPAMPIYHPGYFDAVKGKKSKEIIDDLKEQFEEELRSFFKAIQDTYPNNNITNKKL